MTRSIQKFIPIFLILSFSFFVAMIFLFLDSTNAYDLENDAYQVILGMKVEYDSGIEFVYDDVGATYEGADVYEYLDTSPLYMVDESYMVMPDYTIYVDARGIYYYQVPCFTEVNYESGTIINGVGVSGGFIYDGQNTYTFLDEMTVRINGVDTELGKYSTVSLTVDGLYSLYNKTDETMEYGYIYTSTLEASCSDYSVDLLNDILYTSNNEKILLFDDPELLDVIE
ncbi:hypothetical protein [Tannockella kyphosi]|uniref:hypothetical protein n=1 Tax=Tannockella kyphosi TaxID=2899121 RepID=UPI0020117131|nr:hypothetical protein [Tannockella kyphosi]